MKTNVWKIIFEKCTLDENLDAHLDQNIKKIIHIGENFSTSTC